jgi:release factor glutamine methyltransferase
MTALAGLRRRLRDEALARHVNPRDADLLLSDALGKPVSFIFANGEREVDAALEAVIESALARRFAGEPLQYIRGRTEFYGRDFRVDPRVLIPRPETEILVETALALLTENARVLDVGTGSGCIAITLAAERTDLAVTGSDRSVGALALASRNAREVDAQVRFAASDVLSAVAGTFDMIVSNPPYIPRADVDGLQPEVRLHEPPGALSPGPDGTEIIERLFAEARSRLTTEGRLILEIGYGQAEEVREIAERHGWRVERVVPDLAAIPRIVVSSPC